jgi:16S rRNA (uracil1498-N3)-methyltransferase
MRVPRLYLPVALAEGLTIVLSDERAHYLKTVLRLRLGAELVVFDGGGDEFSAEVVLLSRTESHLRLAARSVRSAESSLPLHLGLGISRGERMDLVIQKAVELGVSTISPLVAERTVVRLEGERRASRWVHWQRVAQSACEQCHRNRIPVVAEPQDLAPWLASARGTRLLLDPAGRHAVRDVMPAAEGVVLLSGPEGGFSQRERAWAEAAGFLPVRFGPRILRAETAAIAALTAAQLLWGDLGA